MKKADILARLEETQIRKEEDFATPANGENIPLPYFVVRTSETERGDDQGRVRVARISWIVALFTRNRDFALECKIKKALAEAGTVQITNYPDGTPYQTNFEFTTQERRA